MSSFDPYPHGDAEEQRRIGEKYRKQREAAERESDMMKKLMNLGYSYMEASSEAARYK